MILKLIIFTLIFIPLEFVINITFFRYLKKYFNEKDAQEKSHPDFLGINISVFKGALERFFIYLGLIIGIFQVLMVFGALKIGTRFEKNNKIKNDYFLIGNFSSILIAILYFYIYTNIIMFFNIT